MPVILEGQWDFATPSKGIKRTLPVQIDKPKFGAYPVTSAAKSVYTSVVAEDGSGDYEHIQDAVDNIASSGGHILVKEGTYEIDARLEISSPLVLDGVGETTVISAANGLNDYVINASGSYITLRNFKINGNSSGQAGTAGGIQMINGRDCILQGIHFYDCLTFGVYNSTASPSRNKFLDNYFNSMAGIGVWTGGDEVLIRGNSFYAGVGTAIYVASSDCSVISSNTFSYGQTCIFHYYGDYCSINNNVFYFPRTPIYLFGSTGNVISANSVLRAYQDGMILAASSNNVISSNSIYGASYTSANIYSGIILQSLGSNHSTRNSITTNSIIGLGDGGVAKLKYGIRENSALDNYNIISGNMVKNCVTKCISKQGLHSEQGHNITDDGS